MNNETKNREREYTQRLEAEKNEQLGVFSERTTSMTHEEVDARLEQMQGLSYGLLLDTTVPKYSEHLQRDIEAGPSEKMIKLRRWNWRRQRGKRRDAASGIEQEREVLGAQLRQLKAGALDSVQERLPELCRHQEGNDFSSWLSAGTQLAGSCFEGEELQYLDFINRVDIIADIQEAQRKGNPGKFGPGVLQAKERASSLTGFWKTLHEAVCGGAAFTPDTVMPLLDEYKRKKLISGRLADEHLDDISVNNPNSCLLLMYQSVSGIMLDALLHLPRSWVNFSSMSKLYAASSGIDLLCGSMVNSDDHIEKERQLAAEKAEEDERINQLRLQEEQRILQETRQREIEAASLENERKKAAHRAALSAFIPEQQEEREKLLDELAELISVYTPAEELRPLALKALDTLQRNLDRLDKQLSQSRFTGGRLEYILQNESLRRSLTLKSCIGSLKLRSLMKEELEAPDIDELISRSRDATVGDSGKKSLRLLGRRVGDPDIPDFTQKAEAYLKAKKELDSHILDLRMREFPDHIRSLELKYEQARSDPKADKKAVLAKKHALDRNIRIFDELRQQKADDTALVEELSPYKDYIERDVFLGSRISLARLYRQEERQLNDNESHILEQEPQWDERLASDLQALELGEWIEQQGDESVTRYVRRCDNLAKYEIIKQYPGLVFTDDAFCQKMLTARNEEYLKLRDEKLEAIYKAVNAAEPVLAELGMAPLLARGCAAAFVAKNGTDIFEQSPEAVRFMLASFAEEQRLTGEVLSRQHEKLEKEMDEAGVLPADRLLLHRQLQSAPPKEDESLPAHITRLYKNLEANRQAMEGRFIDLELDSVQEELLREALEQRLCDAPESFNELLEQRCRPEMLPAKSLPLMKQSRGEQFCTEHLLGSSLLNAEEFAGAFAGCEDTLLKSFEQLAADGVFAKYGVKPEMRLDSMSGEVPVGSFMRLTAELRGNLRKYRAAWQELPDFKKEQLQRSMLPEMLRGKMDAAGFRGEYEKQRALLLQREVSEEKSFELELIRPYAAAFPVFDIQEQTQGGGFFSSGSRVVRRLSRMHEAAEKKASGKLKTAKTVEEKYCDYGEELVRELEADGSIHELEKADYEARLEALGSRTLARQAELDDFLKAQGLDTLREGSPQKAMLDMAMPRMRSLLVHLLDERDGEGWAEKNRSRFGVGTLSEARERLATLINTSSGEQLALISEMEKVRAQRLEQLKQGDDGVLSPLLPYIEQSEGFRLALTTATPEEFERTVRDLRQRALAPMKLIYGFSGGHRYLADQLTLRLRERILSGDTSAMGEKEWYELISAEENRLMEFEVGGASLMTGRALLLDNKTLRPFVSAILDTEDMGFLSDKKRTKQVIKLYEERIKANTALAKAQIRLALQDEKSDPGYKTRLKRLEFGYPRAMLHDMARLSPEEFSQRLQGSLEEYIRADEQLKTQTEQISLRMSEMEESRTRIDRLKQLGRDEEKEAGFARLRETSLRCQRQGLTPLMRLYGAKKPVKLTEERKQRGLDTLCGTPPNYDVHDEKAKAMLFELIGAGVEPEFAAYQAARTVKYGNLKLISDKALDDSAKDSGERPNSELEEDFLHYLLVTRRDLTGKSPAPSDEEQTRIVSGAVLEYITKQAALRRLRVLRAEDDSDPVIRCEINDALNVFSYEYYTMDARELKAAVESRIQYINNSRVLSAAIDRSLDRYAAGKVEALPETSHQRLKMGLRDCFHARMLKQETVQPEALEMELDGVFADETLLRYIEDSSALMSGVSSGSLVASEVTANTLLDREGFGLQLAELATKKQLEAYNALTPEEQRLFDYRLSAPADLKLGEQGFSTDISQKMGRSELAVEKVRRVLEAYSKGIELTADVDYTAAMSRLCVGKRLSETVFTETLEQTKRFSRLHDMNFEPDFELLGSSGADTLRLARRVKKDLPLINPAARSADALISRLSELDGENAPAQTLSTIKELDSADWKLLLLILQDRTMTDLSTRPTGGIDGEEGEKPFVNERGRRSFIERAHSRKAELLKLPVPPSVYQNALSSLLGYQIRDDRRVWAGGLDEDCLAGLERKTVIDWQSLQRALDMLAQTK